MKKYGYWLVAICTIIFIVYISYDPYKYRHFNIEEMRFLNQYYEFSSNKIKTYSRKFVISGFKYNDDLQDSLVDVYVCNIMDSLRHENCIMAFYKESKYTNVEYLLDYPKGIYRESSDDLVIEYSFRKNIFDNKMVFSLNNDKPINTRISHKLRCPK